MGGDVSGRRDVRAVGDRPGMVDKMNSCRCRRDCEIRRHWKIPGLNGAIGHVDEEKQVVGDGRDVRENVGSLDEGHTELCRLYGEKVPKYEVKRDDRKNEHAREDDEDDE